MMDPEDDRFENVDEDLLVANVKRHLMSRDDKIKLEAVQFLLTYLESKILGNDNTSQNSCDRFIEADIVEYLGEAMATQDPILLGEILKCLELFLNSEKLSSQIRAAYVVECMQRTLYFLFKHSQKELSTANDALRLLAVFIEEFNKNLTLKQLFGNDTNISQVLSLVMSILKNKEELGEEITINASLVLYSLFSQGDPALINCESLSEIPDVIQKSLASLALLCNSKDFEKIHTKIIALMAKIGSGALRFCLGLTSDYQRDQDFYESENEVTPSERDMESELQKHDMKIKASKKILACIVSFIQNMWLPFVMKSELDDESLELYIGVLQCIKYLYKAEDFNINNFSGDLAKAGFTILLPFTLNWTTTRNLHHFRHLVQQVMIEYLTCLAEEHLGTSSWLKSFDLKFYFEEGICSLPLRFCDWLNVLNELTVPESCKHFVIMYFYFFCFFLPSLPAHELHFNCLLNYLTSLTVTECPTPVLKAFWFLYTEAVLCQTSVPSLEVIYKSTDILLKFFNNIPCAQLYTHHPAILFWSFSSPRIPTKFQYEMLCLWLEKEDNENYDSALVKMAFSSEDVIFCLLEVVKYGKKKLSCHAASVLIKAILSQKEKLSEGLLCILWDTLPNVLTEYCSESSGMEDHNITYYMEVARTGCPSAPTSKLLLQCATHIMKVLSHFEKTNDICVESRAPAFNLASMCLLMAMKRKDQRVLLSFINQQEFVKKIYHTTGYPNLHLIRPSLQLLMQINEYYEETFVDTQKKGFTLRVDILQILYLLIQEDYDILVCTLNFLYDTITSELPKPLMIIVAADLHYISLPFLQILFRHLQNICSKNIPHVTRNSFKAMGAVLQYAFKMHPENELYSNLATHPWTHTVLRIYFAPKKPEITCELLYFLCWWLHYYVLAKCVEKDFQTTNIRTRKKSRAPYRDLLSESVERVATSLTDSEQFPNTLTSRLAQTVKHRILLLDTNISQELIETLRNASSKTNLDITEGTL